MVLFCRENKFVKILPFFFFFAYFFIFFFFLLLNWSETKFLNFILNVFIGCGKRNEKSSAQDWPTANDHFLVHEE